ncbi:MAG: flagellar filament capping protein FliD [bacterium]|nr:flagellar filament capping protein FliD [bacterium]
MSSVSFSGLATGLDTGSIISQLVELKRAPIYRLQKDKKSYQDQISALGTLKSKLLAVQTAARKLDTASEFSSAKASSSVADNLTATASGTAAPGQYDIVVKTLATAQKLQSQGYASRLDNVGSGTLSITVDGETKSLELVGVTTLEGLAGLINDNFEGVSASVLNTGTGTEPYRLVVNGSAAGTANAFTLDLSGLSGGVTPSMTTHTPAADATLTVDNIEVVATSNTPTDIISGLTLNLLASDTSKHITVTVERDTAGIAGKVKGLVDAYNDLQSYLDKQTGVDGTLRGNAAARSVESRMTGLMGSALQGGLGDVTTMVQMGIKRGEDGALTFDETKFGELLSGQFGGVRDFFINREGNIGKAYLLDQAIKDMTSSTEGLFKISTDSLNQRIKYTDGSIERYERSIDSYQTTLQRRFTAMEQMVSQLQSQGNYLSGIVYQS